MVKAVRRDQRLREEPCRQRHHILKFFLHISPDEQLRRFRQRLDDPARHWKISESDYSEREFWNQYTKAYEDALSKTSTKHAPWYIIPANYKWFRNLAVSKIVAEALESLHMKFPALTVDINDIKRKYHKALRKEKTEERNRKGKEGRPKKRRRKTPRRKAIRIGAERAVTSTPEPGRHKIGPERTEKVIFRNVKNAEMQAPEILRPKEMSIEAYLAECRTLPVLDTEGLVT